MRIPKIKLNKFKNFLKKSLRTLGKHAFLTFLALLFLALILGVALFYQYSVLAEKAEPEITEKPIQFKEKTYQEVLKIWEEQQQEFEEAESKNYPDLFK